MDTATYIHTHTTYRAHLLELALKVSHLTSRPLSTMHSGLTQPCLMYILYNYVRPGSSGTWSFFIFFILFFFDRQDLYLCGDRVLVLGYTEYVGGSSGQYSGYCHASGIPGSPYNPPMTQCHFDVISLLIVYAVRVLRISHECLCVD